MTELSNPEQMRWLVVTSVFILAAVFGAVAQRTHFCTMGAVADIVHLGDWNRMRMWWLAMAVAILGTTILISLQMIDPQKSIYLGNRLLWLSHLIGGLVFGFGMVLASGCGAKTLVRIGGGNLKSLIVFIVLGISAYATLRGIGAGLRANWIDAVTIHLPTAQSLPQLLQHAGLSAQAALWIASGFCASILLIITLKHAEFRQGSYLTGGVVSGLVIVAVWFVSGHIGYLPEDPNTLQEAFIATNTRRMESLSFVAPYAYTLEWLMLWTDQSKILTLGIAAVLGVIAGAAGVALVTRTFRWESFRDVSDTAHHLVGAVCMGFGGITALGCTIGQGLSGISVLALGAILSTLAMIAGARAALRYQVWLLERGD